MNRAEARAWIETLAAMGADERRRALAGLQPSHVWAIAEEWWWGVHGGQAEPPQCADGSDWRIWAIVAGRGFGKTRAGAEWVWQRARDHEDARIALVAATRDEVERVMIHGDSGLMNIARRGEAPRWNATRGLLHFPSGARAWAYTAAQGEVLRGPQHHFAWCDELAKWPKGQVAWDNLMLGLRLGEAPRTIVTTTPKASPLLKRILALPRCAATHGRSDENPHSAEDFKAAVREMYGGTRLGRQELEGLLFDDPEGGLWSREMLEGGRDLTVIARSGATRQSTAASEAETGLLRSARNDGEEGCCGEGATFTRIVIGLDPPASTTGDACGIVVCGMGGDGTAYVLADLTASGLGPEGWARRVAAAAADWGASLIVAEKNQGGEMVGSMLHGVDAALPVRLVAAARKSKVARAEPVALRFETGKAKLAGRFPALEDQMCAMTYRGYEGEGSPDRLDAMVWAMEELLRRRAEPSVRVL